MRLIKKIVIRHLGDITGERLDVFAREAGLLPKSGPYRYTNKDNTSKSVKTK